MLMTYHKAFPAFGIPVLDYSGNQKRTCPCRTGPFVNYIRVIFTPQQLPERLTNTDYQ